MNKAYFNCSKELGNLFFEYSFLSYEESDILFTLLDENKNRFFCLCSEVRNYNNWILVKIDDNEFCDALGNKKSILDIFSEKDQIYFISNKSGKEELLVKNIKTISPEDLPSENIYLDLSEKQQTDLFEFFKLKNDTRSFTSTFLVATLLSVNYNNVYNKDEYRKKKNFTKKSFKKVFAIGGVL